jgi:hypothetical protein
VGPLGHPEGRINPQPHFQKRAKAPELLFDQADESAGSRDPNLPKLGPIHTAPPPTHTTRKANKGAMSLPCSWRNHSGDPRVSAMRPTRLAVNPIAKGQDHKQGVAKRAQNRRVGTPRGIYDSRRGIAYRLTEVKGEAIHNVLPELRSTDHLRGRVNQTLTRGAAGVVAKRIAP